MKKIIIKKRKCGVEGNENGKEKNKNEKEKEWTGKRRGNVVLEE